MNESSPKRCLIGSLLLINFEYHTSGDGMQMKAVLRFQDILNISESFLVICYLYSVNLYFQSFPFQLKLFLGPYSVYTPVGHSNANWLELSTVFSSELDEQRFSSVSWKSKKFWSWEQIASNWLLLKMIFVLSCRCHNASAFMRYWIRGEPNLQFSKNMFLLYFQTPEQAVQTNKAKALGWRYRVDLTLCFFHVSREADCRL